MTAPDLLAAALTELRPLKAQLGLLHRHGLAVAIEQIEMARAALAPAAAPLTGAHREYVKTLAELERLQKLGQLSTGEYQTAVANLTAHRPRASFQPLMDD